MHVGLDAHKKKTVGFVVHHDGSREGPFVMQTTREGLERFAKKHPDGKVLVEASTSGKAVVRFLREQGLDATLVHPDALLLTLRRHKNDEEDAMHLALVAQLGAAKASYLPTPYEEALRCLTRRRYDLVTRITALRNEAHAVLARNLVPAPMGKMTTESTRRRWERIEGLPEAEQFILRGILREMNALIAERDNIRLELYALTKNDETIRRLLTLPGMDVVNAATVRGEYGDLSRFASGKKAASYAGLTPPNWQSGEKELHGRITKKGSPFLRHALVETAHQIRRYPGPLKTSFARLQARIGVRKALVALARRLATIVWSMTTKEKDYAHPDNELTHVKQWRLDAIARLLDQDRRDEALKILNSHDLKREIARGRWQV